MMSLCHCWGWQPTQTAFCVHNRLIQGVWAYWCAVHGHMVAASNSYPHYLAQVLGFWLTCGLNMMWLRHCWGWQPHQTASYIHIRHMQSVWEHQFAVHRHMAVASNSYTHTTWVRFWGSCLLVESIWCHYIMVEADRHIKLLPTSTLGICKVFEHINMLSMGIWH